MTGIKNRLCAALLVLALLLGCVPEALAAEATATTVQLTKTEGTVAISNSSRRSISLIEKMRLYNGYHVETEEASYAWLNLDSAKLTKLDAVSEMELRKSGKKLELLLNEGNIFFNVTEPLEDDESLNIRTSTIVVGIRGTCGWVKIIDQWTAEVYILEGTVTVAVTDPVTGQTKEEAFTGGEKATCVVYPQDRTGDKCDILRDRFTEDDIDGFVLVELVPDEPLVEKIYEETGIDLRDYPGGPEERLKEDQEKVREKLKEIEKELEDQEEHISVDPVWPDGEPVPQPQPVQEEEEPVEEPEPEPAPAPAPRRLMMPLTDDEVQAAVDAATSVYVEASSNPAENTLEVDSGITVPAGKSLTLAPGIGVQVYTGQPLRVHGTMDIQDGTLESDGSVLVTSSNTLHVGGFLVNNGTLTVPATGRVVVDEYITNNGTLAPTQGAVVRAREFLLAAPITDWAVSGAADSAGYYSLVYVGSGNPTPPTPPIDPSVRVTVTFEGNGGLWPDGTGGFGNNVPSGTTLQDAIADVGHPSRTGYTLTSWNTAADGSGTRFTPDMTITADVTLYAQWSADSDWWSYDSGTQTLTIRSSAGSMPDYVYDSTSPGTTTTPWDAYLNEMTSVVIEDGVTYIGAYAFYGADNLSSFNIPSSVVSFGNYIFNGCTSLTSVTLPNSVTSVGDAVFQNCSALTSVTLSNNLESIGYQMFDHCTALTSVVIPSSAASIGFRAFYYCSNLTTITVPNSVTSIGDSAFDYCNNLADIYYAGTQVQWRALLPTTDLTDMYAVTIHCSDGDIAYTPSPRSAVNASPYADVPLDAWYADAVLYCRENGLMNGTDATHFSPDGTLTRAMMVTVLHRLAGTPSATAVAAFQDVEAGQWYTEAVSWANSKGIVLGYDEATFGTNDPVTREQAGLILQRYSGGDVEVPGTDAPTAPATRAEIAAALMNYVKGYGLSAISAMDVMCAPSGIAAMADGTLLVTDTYHKLLWRVRLGAGAVYAGGETVTGLYGEPLGGYNDAEPLESFFKEPWAAAPFLGGWAVSDTANNVIRLVRAQSTQTLNGKTEEKLTVTALGVAFDQPTGLAADEKGNLYAADTGSGAVRKITPEGKVTTAASGLDQPMGLCWKNGALYIAETGANRILKLQNGKVTTVAGNGEAGLADGPADGAMFSAPQGVAVGDDGAVYVSDTGNSAIRLIRGGEVTTLAARDSALAKSGLTAPRGLLLQDGRLYICDGFAKKVFVLRVG